MNKQVLDRLTTKDALKALLHSILFHRLFGTIKPQTIDILGVTMVLKYYSLRPALDV